MAFYKNVFLRFLSFPTHCCISSFFSFVFLFPHIVVCICKCENNQAENPFYLFILLSFYLALIRSSLNFLILFLPVAAGQFRIASKRSIRKFQLGKCEHFSFPQNQNQKFQPGKCGHLSHQIV